MFHRRTLIYALLILAGAMAFAVVCWFAVYAGPVTPDKFEARLQENASAALEPPEYDWAQVEVTGHSAVLRGQAPTAELQDRALQRVQLSSGRGGWFRGGLRHVSDETLLLPPVSPYTLTATKHGDDIVLAGFLPSPDAKTRLQEVLEAEHVDPYHLRFHVDYRDGVPEGDWIGAASLGLRQLVRLLDGELVLTERRILLTGMVSDIEVRNDITVRMARPPSGYGANVEIEGNPVWTARLTGDRLILSGAVPDAAQRTEIYELADRLFDGPVENEMGIRPMRETDWVRGVEAALPNFLNQQSGVMAYMGDELVIEGRATPSVIDFLREDFVRVGVSTEFSLNTVPAATPLDAFRALLETGAPPDQAVCETALEEALTLGPINFEYASDELSRETGRVLDGVQTVLQTCDQFHFVVDAATHADGRRIALQNLTEDRQTAFASYFIARGVPLDQIELSEVRTDQTGLPVTVSMDQDRQISMRLRELEDD